MDEFHHGANVVLVTGDDQLIFQLRDNKPGVGNAGKVGVWGGSVQDTESPLDAAGREIIEETNLLPAPEDFEIVGDFQRSYEIEGKQVLNHVFMLRNIDENLLEVYEGQGYVVVDPYNVGDDSNFTDLTKLVIKNFVRQNG